MHAAKEHKTSHFTSAKFSSHPVTYTITAQAALAAPNLFQSSAALAGSLCAMGPKSLFDDDEILPQEQPVELHVNEEFAKRFEASLSRPPGCGIHESVFGVQHSCCLCSHSC